jgi:hypothetical protein
MKTAGNDKLERYLASLEALRAEKAELEARLAKIDAALAATPALNRGRRAGPSGPARRAQGRRNGLSLREAVTQVTRHRPLRKPEILQAVRKIGYKFATSDPMNSLNAMLYAPANRFRNVKGRFAPK